jgi:hypothetical protein
MNDLEEMLRKGTSLLFMYTKKHTKMYTNPNAYNFVYI